MPSDCLFCRIVAGEIPAKRVYENEQVIAFEDINPQAPTHVLIIHRTHTESHLDTDDPTILMQVMQGAQEVAKQLGLHDYRLVMNNGAKAGQSVFHMHLHLLAGRPFTWPPG